MQGKPHATIALMRRWPAVAIFLPVIVYARVATADKPPDQALFMVVSVDPGTAGLREALRAEIENARRENLRPYVEFWAPWCKACAVLKSSLGDPAMRGALRGTYLIMLNLDDWNNHLGGSGFAPTVIPTFYGLRSDGAPNGRKMDGRVWGNDKPDNMARWLGKFFHPQ
jgi:hypothetical protein